MSEFPNIQQIVEERTAGIMARRGRVERPISTDPVLPESLCRCFSRNCDWMGVSGFPPRVLEDILLKAAGNIPRSRAGSYTPTECTFFSLVFLRLGVNISKLSLSTGTSNERVSRAVHRGLEGLAACFQPGVVKNCAPTLSEIIAGRNDSQSNSSSSSSSNFLSSDKSIPPEAAEARFIVDGRHLPCVRVGVHQDPRLYYSHKLNQTAIQFQVIVTLLGECVFVTPWARASVHDIEVYKSSRSEMLQTLTAIDPGKQIKILGDKGYRTQECDEIVTAHATSHSFNGYRLVVEIFFGRMCTVFLAGSRRMSLGIDSWNILIKSLCHLTTLHINLSPLRADEHRHWYSNDQTLRDQIGRTLERHAEASRRFRVRRSLSTQLSTYEPPAKRRLTCHTSQLTDISSTSDSGDELETENIEEDI